MKMWTIIPKKVNFYLVMDIKHDAVVYQVYAESEKQVRKLAEKEGFDLTGTRIELIRTKVLDSDGKPHKPIIYKE